MLENRGCIGMELRKTAPGAVEVRLSGAELKSLGLSPRERNILPDLLNRVLVSLEENTQ